MAQGKQGIWLLTFPDREFSKFNFLHRENCGNTGKILKIRIFENFVIKVATTGWPWHRENREFGC